MVPLTLSCPHCKSEKLVRNGLAPRDIFVVNVSVLVERIHLCVDIRKRGKKRYCEPIKSEVACVVLREHLVFRVIQL